MSPFVTKASVDDVGPTVHYDRGCPHIEYSDGAVEVERDELRGLPIDCSTCGYPEGK